MTETNVNNSFAQLKSSNTQAKIAVRIGMDVHLHQVVAVIRIGAKAFRAARQFTLPAMVAEVARLVAQGYQVHCVQESCGFGFTFHHQLVAAGAHSVVCAPEALGRRKTDKLDARALAQKLCNFLDGQADALRPIRIPSTKEIQLREISRRRDFYAKQIRSFENRGRSLVMEYYHQPLRKRWWGPRIFRVLARQLDPYVVTILAGYQKILLELEAMYEALKEELIARQAGQKIPKYLGALTMSVIDAEVCSWERFENRNQPGSYVGCCPLVKGSGDTRGYQYGNIDRMGNGTIRRQLVEAVWRLEKHQPGWHALRRWRQRMHESKGIRKKTVVALARQLMVDLWRWRTGRCTLADLGLQEQRIMAPAR